MNALYISMLVYVALYLLFSGVLVGASWWGPKGRAGRL